MTPSIMRLIVVYVLLVVAQVGGLRCVMGATKTLKDLQIGDCWHLEQPGSWVIDIGGGGGAGGRTI